jgi:hypothetical protein
MYWVPGVPPPTQPTPNFVILKIWRFFKIEKLVEFKIGKKKFNQKDLFKKTIKKSLKAPYIDDYAL